MPDRIASGKCCSAWSFFYLNRSDLLIPPLTSLNEVVVANTSLTSADLQQDLFVVPTTIKTDIVGRSADALVSVTSTGVSLEVQANGLWSTDVDWQDINTGDVNGDGLNDYVGRSPNGSWWVALGSVTGFTNMKWGSWSSEAAWTDVNLADVNHDGNADVIGRANGKWWVGLSDGTRFLNQR